MVAKRKKTSSKPRARKSPPQRQRSKTGSKPARKSTSARFIKGAKHTKKSVADTKPKAKKARHAAVVAAKRFGVAGSDKEGRMSQAKPKGEPARRVGGSNPAVKSRHGSASSISAKPDRLAEHRKASLDIYKRLAEAWAKAGKTIPETVRRSHKNLEENQFLLAIVGKVNAGKSTFINALLRSDLLPTDALQATAAIIEIFHAKSPFLRVTYANGDIEEIPSEKSSGSIAPLTQKLQQVAAIPPEERSLPIAQLNDFIIERFDSSSQRAEWNTELIEFLFNQTALPNIHKIPASELQSRSLAYLEHYRDGRKIAKRVEVGFPTIYQFDHFRIVDTPGICAKGGFAERTLEFLVNADGVIYLHKDDPAEETLHEALQNIIPEKAKKHMLLVLTHRGQRTQEQRDSHRSEVGRCCPQIPLDRIFSVDSLTEIILQSAYGNDFGQIRSLCQKNEEWLKCIAGALISSAGDEAELFDLLEQQANMRDLRQKISGMSEKSLAIQIETLLNAVQELYAELEVDASAQRDIYAARMKDPQQFAADTGRRMDELIRLEKESLAKFREIELQFNLDNENQKFGKELKKNCDRAITEIDERSFDSSDTVKTADSFLTKINQDFEDDLKELAVTIAADLREEMSNIQVSLQPGFRIRVPKIPLTDLLQKLREESTSTIEVQEPKTDFFSRILQFLTGGKWGTRVKKEKQFDANEYFASAKSTLRNKFLDRKSSFAQGVKDKMDLIRIEYLKSVSNKIEQRKNEIEKLRDEQIKNKELRKRFDDASANVESAKREIAECKRIRGNL